MHLSDKMYQILKWIALYVLPASGTFYYGLSSIWGFPFGEEVVATTVAIETFLGGLLGISSYQYDRAQKELGDK